MTERFRADRPRPTAPRRPTCRCFFPPARPGRRPTVRGRARARPVSQDRRTTAVLATLMLTWLVVVAPPAAAGSASAARLRRRSWRAVGGQRHGDRQRRGAHVGPNGSLRVGFNPDQRGDWWGTVLNGSGSTLAPARLDSTLRRPLRDDSPRSTSPTTRSTSGCRSVPTASASAPAAWRR